MAERVYASCILRGDYDRLIQALGFEFVGKRRFPPQDELLLAERQEIVNAVIEYFYDLAQDIAANIKKS